MYYITPKLCQSLKWKGKGVAGTLSVKYDIEGTDLMAKLLHRRKIWQKQVKLCLTKKNSAQAQPLAFHMLQGFAKFAKVFCYTVSL